MTHQINVTAPDAADLCGLYVSAARANAYGKNALADGTVLAAQAGMSIPVDAIGDYDLKLVAYDGREEVMPINVPLSGSALIPPVCRSAHGGGCVVIAPRLGRAFPQRISNAQYIARCLFLERGLLQ